VKRKVGRGFTLVEALTVVGVVGLLAGLTLPAVQRAREAAARVACSNNLRQIGLALNAYTAALDRMPLGVGLPNRKQVGPDRIVLFKQYSVFAQLLPHLERRALFDATNFDVGLNDFLMHPGRGATAGIEANRTVAASTVATFLCPSDAHLQPLDFGGCSYRANLGASGSAFPSDGPFMDGLRSTGPAAITDGLSATLAFSEKLRGSGGSRPHPRRDMYYMDAGWSHVPERSYETCSRSLNTDSRSFTKGGATWLIGTLSQSCYNHVMAPNDPVPDCVQSRMVPVGGLVGARSDHSGGVQGAFCDGSVRFILNGVTREVWKALGTRAGGELIEASSF